MAQEDFDWDKWVQEQLDTGSFTGSGGDETTYGTTDTSKGYHDPVYDENATVDAGGEITGGQGQAATGIDAIIKYLKSGELLTDGINIVDTAGNFVQSLYNSGTLGQIVEALMNNNQIKDNTDKLREFQQAGVGDLQAIAAQIGSMSQPDLEALAKARPDLLPLIQQSKSEYNKINVDPTSMNASKESLAQLSNVATEGYGPIERAAAARVLGQMSNANRGQQEAIKTDMQARGQWGVGNELTKRMIASEMEANRASQEGLEIESQAAKRALEAIRDKGKLGLDINTQEFGQQEAAAKAQDVINKFNTDLTQKVNEANLTQQNLQQQRQMAARQQQYDNLVDQQKAKLDAAKAAGTNAMGMYKSTNDLAQAGLAARAATVGNLLTPRNTAQPVTVNVNGQTGTGSTAQPGTSAGTGSTGASNSIGQTIGQIGSAVKTGKDLWDIGSKAAPYVEKAWEWGKNIISDEEVKNNKKDMSDDDICKILDGLAPMSFNYKQSATKQGMPHGKVIGVMAQNIEKTPAKAMVSRNKDGVKEVDPVKAISLALASLGSVHNRVKKLEGK